MRLFTLIALALLAITMAQMPGCHYYVDATPHFILSSEPIHQPERP